MGITNFRVTPRTLQRRIHEAAKSSSVVLFIPQPNKEVLAGMMTYQQAMACLRKGNIVGKPELNAHGDWELQMERFAANYLYKLRAAVTCSGAHVTRIYVFLTEENV